MKTNSGLGQPSLPGVSVIQPRVVTQSSDNKPLVVNVASSDQLRPAKVWSRDILWLSVNSARNCSYYR